MASEAIPAPGDWNVVVTAYPKGRRPALRALRRLGPAAPSGHYNVLLATADDPVELLATLERQAGDLPVLNDTISRVAPAQAGFRYAGDEDFARQAEAVALAWAPRLAGKSFHVRLHPRGAGLSGHRHEIEARLAAKLLDAVKAAGGTARIEFDDPDLILAIDAIHGRAGLGLWSREEMRGHPFLRPD